MTEYFDIEVYLKDKDENRKVYSRMVLEKSQGAFKEGDTVEVWVNDHLEFEQKVEEE